MVSIKNGTVEVTVEDKRIVWKVDNGNVYPVLY